MEDSVVNLLKKIEESWPYKRVVIPKHLLDRWNEGKDSKTVTLALTVDKSFDETDEEKLWELLQELEVSVKKAKRLDFGDLRLKGPVCK